MSAPAYAPTPALVPEPDEPRCPNCGTVATRNFCPECGQECISFRLSLRDFAHEFLDDHVGWSTKVPRTLGRLLFQPGELTRDFIDGRRVRYLSPLRLYLSLSVIFFLVVASPPSWSAGEKTSTTKSTNGALRIGTGKGVDVNSGAADSETVTMRAARLAAADSMQADLDRRPPDTTRFKGRTKALFMRRGIAYARMDGKQRKDLFLGGMLQRIPNVMFVLLPLFALYLKLLYWRRRRFYAEHVVFALHTHAVAYALLTLGILSPWTGARAALLAASALYFVLALRRVYGGGVFRTLVKSAALGTAYVLTIGVAATALGVFVFLFASA